MREDAKRSPYPKADLTLRGLARLADFALAWALSQTSPAVGPVLAAVYLLVADGLMAGQSVGKRVFGVRAMVVPRRVPAGLAESALRNAPFALVVLFDALPMLWAVLFLAGVPIVAYESWRVVTNADGLRLGDVLADTQVVDAKVLSKAGEASRGALPVAPAPAPPTPPVRAARAAAVPPARPAA